MAKRPKPRPYYYRDAQRALRVSRKVVGAGAIVQVRKSRYRTGEYADRDMMLRFKVTGPNKKSRLSILRHEIGHMVEDAGGVKVRQRKRWFPKWDAKSPNRSYRGEMGAWAAAIKYAPNHRVDWKTVKKGLLSHAREAMAWERLLGHKPKGTKLGVARDIKVLQRYGRRLRAQKQRQASRLNLRKARASRRRKK